MAFYQKGDVRIRYAETGTGFPLLVTPGGGLNSRVSNWPTAVINAMEEFKNDFRFAGKLLQRAPQRVVAAVFCQTVGHRPELPDYMYNSGKDAWAPELLPKRPDLNMAQVEQYLHNLYRVNPDFLYSVSRDFIRNCRTPILVLPDDTPAHPLQTSIDVASLAPNAEITVFPWKEPADLKVRTINRVRSFLKAHVPMRAAAQ